MIDLNALKREYQNRSVTVVGVGISNRPLVDFLLSLGACVTARDRKERSALGTVAEDFEKKGVKLILGEGYLDNIEEEIIFKTPGMRFDTPALVAAVARGARLTSEMQLFFELCPCPIIGITGSDGKTTTTTLIAKILEADGKRVHLGGNIGKPLLPEVFSMTPADYAVVELSSFQLHILTRSPHIAVITNLSPNHLDYHLDMDEYVAAKMNLLTHQSRCDRAVLNFSNAYTRQAAALTSAPVTFFSSQEEPPSETAVYEKDGVIFCGKEPILKTKDILLPGRHNVENYMAAIGALWGLVSPEAIRRVARTFGGVEHRIELVRTLDGVRYYNSSIDSSPSRTMAALKAFGNEKLIVLLGGKDKNISYEALGTPLCEHAKAILLNGPTAEKIREAVLASPLYREGTPLILTVKDYTEATYKAHEMARAGDTVLLSPASTSFDAFANFEERGKLFKAIVNSFESKT